MARPEGFEPPTNRIGTCYSIQLSYGRFGSVCGPYSTDQTSVCQVNSASGNRLQVILATKRQV